MPRLKTGYIRELKTRAKNGKEVVKLKACWDYIDQHGKLRSKSKIVNNITEADVFFNDTKNELAKGVEIFDHKDMTFAEYAESYKTTHLVPAVIRIKKSVKGGSVVRGAVKVRGLRSHVARKIALQHLVEYFGKRKLSEIKRKHILLYQESRLAYRLKNGKPLEVATINKELAALRHMLKEAQESQILEKTPSFRGIICKKAENTRARRLQGDEEDRLLAACELPDRQGRFMRRHIKPILICALDTGMRKGEILKLEWGDVSFDENVLMVRAETTKTLEPKDIPISKRLRRELEAMYADQKPKPSDKVFRRKILGKHGGKQVREPHYVEIKDNFQTAWEGILRDAQVEDFVWHDSRHDATTKMVVSGMSESLVKKITGHKNLDMFMRYLNPSADELNREYLHFETYRAAAELEKAQQATQEMVN
jgi:integrase